MPSYTVTDPDSGKSITLTGDSPPTEQELNDIFAQVHGGAAPQEDPGAIKSLGLGLMSGIPGAETAATTIKSSLSDRPYEDVHKEIEGAKDAAWGSHPIAYGGGKTASTIGTGIVAPEGLTSMAATGAAYGVDAAKNPGEIPEAAAIGGAEGYGLGKAGNWVSESVVKPLIEKFLPGAAKNLLAALPRDASKQDIEELLRSKDLIDAALSKPEAATKLAEVMNKLGVDTSELSAKAKSMLDPEAPTLTAPLELASKGVEPMNGLGEKEGLVDRISPIFDQMKEALSPEGFRQVKQGKKLVKLPVASTPEIETAINSLEAQKQRLIDIAAKHGGAIPETRLQEIIKDLQDTVNPATWGSGSGAKETQLQMKALSGRLNALLKGADEFNAGSASFGNPAYGDAMKPVAENTKLLESLKDTFKPNYENGKFSPSEDTNRIMGNVLKEPKTETRDLLEQLRRKQGFDFITNAKADELRTRFEEPGMGAGGQALSGLAGIGLGATVGHPYIGGFLGRQISTKLDGGTIARSIIGKYLQIANHPVTEASSKALQTYGPMLVNAAKQGGNNLAATHFVLATSHPAYQKLIEQEQNSGQ